MTESETGMARTRPGLEKAVVEILEKNGKDGKKMSFRQAERVTGLSPATVAELAKGNARTTESIRRFAEGFQEDESRLLLLAGFVPEEEETPYTPNLASPGANGTQKSKRISNDVWKTPENWAVEGEELEWLGRYGRALAKMPPGRERDLWKDSLRKDTELIESFLERLTSN